MLGGDLNWVLEHYICVQVNEFANSVILQFTYDMM